ncbi:hypothetical protein [Bradyrhizobium liaoningense]|uniref:hypothetical protein n=1 Tax=Bradyrhizobium liaoningense TaxID=43992 RepID=UPI001BAAA6B7|nr:hypothetical protein [Bradyrhizobium liaoningense]MBR0717255.1 hypothetical protein [Bradyrhizobium liaoningense]
MILRAVGAAVSLLILLNSEAFAVRNHSPTGRVSCAEVRYYVAKYSAPVAEMYARRHGATDAQIERARRCLASNESAETERGRSYTD